MLILSLVLSQPAVEVVGAGGGWRKELRLVFSELSGGVASGAAAARLCVLPRMRVSRRLQAVISCPLYQSLSIAVLVADVSRFSGRCSVGSGSRAVFVTGRLGASRLTALVCRATWFDGVAQSSARDFESATTIRTCYVIQGYAGWIGVCGRAVCRSAVQRRGAIVECVVSGCSRRTSSRWSVDCADLRPSSELTPACTPVAQCSALVSVPYGVTVSGRLSASLSSSCLRASGVVLGGFSGVCSVLMRDLVAAEDLYVESAGCGPYPLLVQPRGLHCVRMSPGAPLAVSQPGASFQRVVVARSGTSCRPLCSGVTFGAVVSRGVWSLRSVCVGVV